MKLTKRELEQLQLAAQGLTRQEIADVMGVSYETVVTRCNSVINKTGARNQVQAMYVCMKAGLLDDLEVV